MAKFSRHDPRNKKKDRTKQHSQLRDLRIRMEEEKGRRKNWGTFMWTDNDSSNDGESDDYKLDTF